MDLKRYANQNIWVSLLRILMCFVVVQIHFQTIRVTDMQIKIHYLDDVAVPCFMFVSFYYMAKAILNSDIEKFKSRLLRLYIPVLFWNTFYFVVKNIVSITVYGESYRNLRSLFISFFCSNFDGLANQLWFLIVQIFELIALFIFLQFGKSQKTKLVMLCSLLIITFVYEYWGIFYEFFAYGQYETRYTLGRSMECMPFAICGILFYWLKNIRNAKLIYAIPVITLPLTYYFRHHGPDVSNWTWGYSGFYIFFFTLAICTLVFCLPVFKTEKLKPVNIAINWLGSLTMGVYCLHLLVGWALDIIASFHMDLFPTRFGRDTLVFDVIVFAISIVITILVKFVCSKLKCKLPDYIM